MSNATGGSSVHGSLSASSDKIFDMGNEHDLIALLRRIHLSPLSLEIKNRLRDLVFSTRFGVPAPVDATMVAAFSEHGFVITPPQQVVVVIPDTLPLRETPSLVQTQAEPPVIGRIGFSRETPHFDGVAVPLVASSVSTEPVLVSDTVAAPATTATYVPELEEILLEDEVLPVAQSEAVRALGEVATQIVAEEPAMVVDVPVVTPVREPSSMQAPEIVQYEVPQEVLPSQGELSPAAEVPLVPEMPVPSVSTVAPADRIAEIKREVNALVGNPVNLIDVNNDVGREYMNALLDAMKKSLGSTPAQEIERAMARLERAFVSVKQTLNTESSTPTPTPTPTPTIAPELEVLPEVMVAAPDVPEVANVVTPAPIPAVPDVTSVVLPAESTEVHEETQKLDDPEVPRTSFSLPVLEVSSPNVSTKSIAAMRMMPDTPPPVTTPVQPITPVETTVMEPRVDIESTALAPDVDGDNATVATEVITSAAKEKQLKELMEARRAAEAASSVERAKASANNPLMADEVTNGLHQLLSEWKLFKSSGIFGTGPSGYEHPLYKKLAQLTMSAVLAGRFEGANADIKRSISDYMNGWRYEEGVQHEQGESFEMYLRRVIRHILDNQVKK